MRVPADASSGGAGGLALRLAVVVCSAGGALYDGESDSKSEQQSNEDLHADCFVTLGLWRKA